MMNKSISCFLKVIRQIQLKCRPTVMIIVEVGLINFHNSDKIRFESYILITVVINFFTNLSEFVNYCW